MIALIGAEGELGRRVCAQLRQRHELLLIDRHNRAELEQRLGQLRMALILTPPASHADYLQWLSDAGVPRVLCEKPLPVLPRLRYPERVRVIDHYLFKARVGECVACYRAHADRIRTIKLSLCESKPEVRPWMWSRVEHGGVILDLGHHMVSLLGLMAEDFGSLSSVGELRLGKIGYFDHPEAAESALQLTFDWAGIQVSLALGKQGEERKTVELCLDDGTCHRFDLSDRVDYREVVDAGVADDTSPLLRWDEAGQVSRLLNRMRKLID